MKIDLSKLFFIISILLLLYLVGATTVYLGHYPKDLVELGKETFDDIRQHWKSDLGIRPTRFIKQAQHAGSGVTINVPGAPSEGLTLISGLFDDQVALRLIDLEGNVVNQWPVKFDEVFRDTDQVEEQVRIPSNKWAYTVQGAAALPDGSVIFSAVPMLAKLDRCGSVQWSLPAMTHHSVFMLPDGSFWAPTMRWFRPPPENFWSTATEVRDDLLTKFAPDGTVLKEISLLEVLFQNNL